MIEQIIALNQRLQDACEAYYVSAEPVMSDGEYDVLEAELRGLVAANQEYVAYAPVLKTVGSDIVSDGKRVPHVRKMLSIENNYAKEDVVKWCSQFPEGTVFCVESKYDGNSAEFRFKDWKLTQVLTRGTGTEGEDITAQVMALDGIPTSLRSRHPEYIQFPSSLNIRGEMVMPDSEFTRINAALITSGQQPYNCARNVAAGTLKQKDLSVVAARKLVFIPWDMYSEDENLDGGGAAYGIPSSRANRMFNLHEYLGFPEHTGILVDKVEDIIPAIDKILALNEKSDIHADGVVIKVDSISLCKELGEASKFTNWMTCFKPQSLAAETVLREVAWQMGRSGACAPVAVFDPVILGGATVTRAYINNLSWLEALGLKIGSGIKIVKSGDIIPQVVGVLDDDGTPIIPPTHCPECSSLLTLRGASDIDVLQCDNPLCPGRLRAHFAFIGKREYLEIDNLAEEMARKIVDGGYARNVGELFEFQVEASASLNKIGEERFASLMANDGFSVTIIKMLRSMENAKSASWERWIAALGIPMIGRTLGKVLATQFQLDSEVMLTLPDILLKAGQAGNISALGPVKSRILIEWASDPGNQQICQTLYKCGVRPKPLVRKVEEGAMANDSLKGVVFCITGEFAITRVVIGHNLVSLGAEEKSGVTKKLTHLIVGSAPGSSKLRKYEELVAGGANIQKVGKDWLEKVLADAGMPMPSTDICEIEEA